MYDIVLTSVKQWIDSPGELHRAVSLIVPNLLRFYKDDALIAIDTFKRHEDYFAVIFQHLLYLTAKESKISSKCKISNPEYVLALDLFNVKLDASSNNQDMDRTHGITLTQATTLASLVLRSKPHSVLSTLPPWNDNTVSKRSYMYLSCLALRDIVHARSTCNAETSEVMALHMLENQAKQSQEI